MSVDFQEQSEGWLNQNSVLIFGSGINISDMVNEAVFGFFLLFEDKGRLQACCNGIKICLPPGQSLSRALERDRHLMETKSRSRHS